ncbi:hypothetical protein FACS1894108_12330 [Planctomycetales bacterium]|nr:hypothetical protein FACS1894108_12330 [Planctomycetales bacterium]
MNANEQYKNTVFAAYFGTRTRRRRRFSVTNAHNGVATVVNESLGLAFFATASCGGVANTR